MKKQLRLKTMDRSSGFLRHRHRQAEARCSRYNVRSVVFVSVM